MAGPDYCVVVPILNPNLAGGMVKLAAALAGAKLEGLNRHIRILILGIVTVPEETPLSQGASLVKAYRTMLRYIPQNSELDERLEVHTEVRVAREVWQGIRDQVKEEHGDLLLLHWKGSTHTPDKIYGDTIDALLNDPPCDIVLARFNNTLPDVKNILLPVRGGSYSNLALTLASNLAEEWQAGITVLHSLAASIPPAYPSYFGAVEPEPLEDPMAALQNLLLELPAGARLVTVHGQVASGIVREAHFHDLLILGASDPGPKEPAATVISGKLAERIAAETTCPLLVVKTRRPFELNRPMLGIKSEPAFREPSLNELVDRWFAENTFQYREFRSMSSLTLLKERNDLSISLVWPVYGKVQPTTLAETVRRSRFALMRDCALLDEIVVCSPNVRFDETEIAAFYSWPGAHPRPEDDNDDQIVYYTPEIIREAYPDNQLDWGPGESLWQALRRARGDIIVWGDPTMVGFEARLIYGLVGPLLSYPEFQLATGFYSTPENHSTESIPVYNDLTELSLRPMLGGFFPQLAGVINPVCTVGAARRELLERLPLFTGPAFTPALLADTSIRSGLMSIAQVDLGAPPDFAETLSSQRITSDVLLALLRRAEERTQSPLLTSFNPGVKRVQKTEGVYSLKLEASAAPQRELPPIAFTAGYKRPTF